MRRERLLRRLQTDADAPVIVVRAPAGYGKSMLLSQFAADDPRRIAWLSLGEFDQDPVVLIHDLAHALANVGPLDADLLSRLSAGAAGIMPSRCRA